MCEDSCAVYVHVNLINGKKYFGITIQEPEKRWKNGYGYSNNAHFTNAINKYGWDGFAHHVLYRNIPIKIAKNIEEMLINEQMSYDPRFGYNKTMGGELEIPSEETRRKMSANNRIKNNPERNPNPPKAVEAIDPESGQVALRFKSIRDAERAGFNSGNVASCCNSNRKTHAGLIWRHVEEVNDNDSDN